MTKYGIINVEEPKFQFTRLFVVPYKDKDLTVSYPAFGPDPFEVNLKEICNNYSHPKTRKKISFRPATTSESISAAAYDFKHLAKPGIFDGQLLQAGYITETQDGIFTNTEILDEKTLKELLNKAKKINGIYFIDDRIAFAPRQSFDIGIQDCDSFVHGGLARALEHTPEKVAKNLKEIASPEFYNKGVNVGDFNKFEKPVLRIVSLYSGRGFGNGRLYIHNNGGWSGGYAFGVLKEK